MKKLKELIQKYKSLILYIFFGVCTTVVNVASYYVCFNLMKISNVVSTVIAWVLAVLFAYITNKLWVFESKSFKSKILLKEILAFFGCRLVTGGLDVAIMYITVDVMHSNGNIWKIVSNILVIIINYVASKLLIFKKDSNQREMP